MSIDFGSDIYEEPIVAKTFLQEDAQEGSLRPKTLREYIGQEKAKENLSVFIEAARKREEALDHVLLHGPPGLGKTTLAGIIAQEMGAGILNVEIEPDGAYEIARRSRGTPRIANRMLRRVRDFAQVKADGVITAAVADEALCALEVDQLGLDSVDRRMLGAIIDHYNGGPVGLETLAATIGEEAVTLEDVYEPYLMQLGFLTRTPRGRCVTQKAYGHLHRPIPGGAAPGMGRCRCP